MTQLKGYHCNTCGAWLMQGEKHTCDKERLDMVDRIASFLSQSHHDDLEADALHQKVFHRKLNKEEIDK